MFKLVISDDEGKTTVVPLVRDEVTIGRKEGNTIRLTERNVSRRHAKLLKSNGAFLVEDLNSYNGVKLNGRKIDGRASLKAGDQLGIGDYMLALQVESAEVADQSTAAIAAQAPSDAATAMIAAPTEPRPPARLVMLTPPAPGAEFALSRERQRIGRAEDLPIWVNHRSISREHAEIVRDSEGFKLVDLGSANGVRLNGKDVETAPLQPGDVVELGQVRFRFVGEGETYIFDSDATVQMEAVAGAPAVSRAPMFAAVGIILTAVVVAAFVAIGGGDDSDEQPTVTPIDPPITNATEASPGAATDERLERAVADCRAALDRGQLDSAIGFASSALEIAPGHSGAAACKAEAETRQQEQTTFDSGLAAFNAGNYEQAALAFGTLSDPTLRARSEVVRTFEELLRMAEQQLATSPENAAHLADLVLTTPGVSAALRGRAESIKRRASEPPAVASAAETTARERERERERVSAMRVRERETGMDQTQQTTTQTQEPTGPNPMQACVAEPNYNQCLIQRLRNPRTPREFAALATAYNERGDRARGCDLMRTLVQRFPSSVEARRMGQILTRQCN
jgi:pSer/pThr/pTyr-binding forkhead associated (FHA) protein